MPDHRHLKLRRLPETLERRKKPGFSAAKSERRTGYGRMVRRQVEDAARSQQRTKPSRFVDPSLIFRVQMQGMLQESDWESLGLRLLSSDEDRNIVLFSSNGDLDAFYRRLDDYDGPIPEGQRGRRYENFVAALKILER